nr:hypothetical protein [Tanacetum cinerariifolium]
MSLATQPSSPHTQPSTSQPQKNSHLEGGRGRPPSLVALQNMYQMSLVTHLSQDFTLLEIKTTQVVKIEKLKKRVEKLEGKKKKRTRGLKRLHKVGLSAKVVPSDEEGLDAQEDASKQGRNEMNDQEMMFDMTAYLQGEEVVVNKKAEYVQEVVDKVVKDINVAWIEKAVTTANQVSIAPVTSVELTLAEALVEIKIAQPKAKSIVFKKLSEKTKITIPQ